MLAGMPRFLGPVLVVACVSTFVGCRSDTGSRRAAGGSLPDRSPPNVVIVFTDDQGYGDLSCYGNPTIHTPHLDRMAGDGSRFTQFYVASPVCSPSRAALLTGCYPKRVGMERHVIFPGYDYGLHPDEVTLADLLRERGYATGMFGKWHLGHRPGLLPCDQGFDTFFGVPYSNDMSRFQRPADTKYGFHLPLMRDREVIEWEPDQRLLTRRYTEEAVRFIDAHHREPFFVYLPHSMPHIPIYASEPFDGRSPRGLYGDVIEEIDWSVGQLLEALERNGVANNTLVIFSSDNGPWLQFKEKGGSAGPLRGGKGTNREGGQRVPFVVRWPEVVPAGGVCREVVTALDILPTIAALTGAGLPVDRPIDGRDRSALLRGDPGPAGERLEDPFLYYTSQGELAGIRRGPWKLLLEPGELYQLETDLGEERNVAEQHAELVESLRQQALLLDEAITRQARPVLHVEELLFDPARPLLPDGTPFDSRGMLRIRQ